MADDIEVLDRAIYDPKRKAESLRLSLYRPLSLDLSSA